MPANPDLYIFSNRKKVLDLTVASTAAMLAAPIEWATARALRKSIGEGPAYFEQERLGFTLRKLRTMLVPGAGEDQESVWDSSSLSDPRIPSGVAKFARSSRFDELPQLRQVVRGALAFGVERRLSMVGIRPLLDDHAAEFYEAARAKEPEAAERWYKEWIPNAPLGVISPAAAHYMGRSDNKEVDAATWVRLEDEYCQNADTLTDLTLMGNTMGKMANAAGSAAVSAAVSAIAAVARNITGR